MPYVFDAYGTLFDVHAAIARHRAAAGPDADRFSELWRQKQLEYTWTLTLAGRYVDFWTLTQDALDFAFARFPSVDKALRRKLLDAYLKLDAFPDARAVLRALRANGERTAILSNGSPDDARSRRSRRQGSRTISTRCSRSIRVQMYKPRPEVYALVTTAFAVPPAEVTFVSSNRWDVMGAVAFGFRAVWINRGHVPDEYADCPPAAVLSDLSGLMSLGR